MNVGKVIPAAVVAMAAFACAQTTAPAGSSDLARHRRTAAAIAEVITPAPAADGSGESIVDGIPAVQEQILAGVLDRARDMVDSAYALSEDPSASGRAAALLAVVDQPAYVNLLRRPEAYRLQPVRMEVKVIFARPWPEPAGGQTPSADRQDPAMWRLECFAVGPGELTDFPVVVFTRDKPSLPEPVRADPQTGEEFYYKRGQTLTAIGLFYKTLSARAMDDQMRDYPVIAAGTLLARPEPIDPAPGRNQALSLILLVAAMVIGYFVVRRTLRNMGSDDETPYRPRRYDSPTDTRNHP